MDERPGQGSRQGPPVEAPTGSPVMPPEENTPPAERPSWLPLVIGILVLALVALLILALFR